MMKTKYNYNKNLRHVNVVITAQTLYHLNRLAAMNGWGDRDIGRVLDKIVRTMQIDQKESGCNASK